MPSSIDMPSPRSRRSVGGSTEPRYDREMLRGLAFAVPASLLGWALVLLPIVLALQ